MGTILFDLMVHILIVKACYASLESFNMTNLLMKKRVVGLGKVVGMQERNEEVIEAKSTDL